MQFEILQLVQGNEDELKEAAMRIQAGFRGYKARQEIQVRKADLAKVQINSDYILLFILVYSYCIY